MTDHSAPDIIGELDQIMSRFFSSLGEEVTPNDAAQRRKVLEPVMAGALKAGGVDVSMATEEGSVLMGVLFAFYGVPRCLDRR